MAIKFLLVQMDYADATKRSDGSVLKVNLNKKKMAQVCADELVP